MINNILLSGCSFVEGHNSKNASLSIHLKNEFDCNIIDVSWGGKGNEYISNSLISELISLDSTEYDNVLVVCGWSEVMRQEIFWNPIDENPVLFVIRTNDFLESSWNSDIWFSDKNTPHTFIRKNSDVLRVLYSDLSFAFYKSYMSMISLKNFCDSHGIKYIFFDSINSNKILSSNHMEFESKPISSQNSVVSPVHDFGKILNTKVSNFIYDDKFIDIFGYNSTLEWLSRENYNYFDKLTLENDGHPNGYANSQIAKHIKTKFKEIYN